MDGAHLIWEYTPKQGGILSSCLAQQRHEIILRDVLQSAELSRDSLVRVRAYCAVILDEGEKVDRKKLQKKWEAKIEKGQLPEEVCDERIDFVCNVIREEFQKKLNFELECARDGLRHAVIKAHEKLSNDECRLIIDAAIVESVMSK